MNISTLCKNNSAKTSDMYGHTVGDELIRSTAVCLKRAFEDYGGAYRIGGDEFVVIMTEIDEVGVLRCINKLQNILKEENLSRDVPIDLAMGYNCEEILEGKENIDNIFIKADENMYNNKRIIKNNHQNI